MLGAKSSGARIATAVRVPVGGATVAWDFAVLGALRASYAGQVVEIPAGKQRTLLATLLLDANQTVSVNDIVDRVWSEQLPAHANAALHSLVLRLRRTLSGDGARPDPIGTGANGYLADVPAGGLDLTRFQALRARARESDPVLTAELLSQALALWRGEPLIDVPSETLHRENVPALAEQRSSATEEYFDAELALGRHAAIVPPLHQAVQHNPLREQLWTQLMLALYRSGRQAEALAAYRTLSGILRDELGLDPGPGPRRLLEQILSSDPILEPARDDRAADSTLPPPAGPLFQLPADPAPLYGRDLSAERIRQIVTGTLADGRMPLVCVSGPPGIGKTALAVHVAHSLREEFPDGQWYVRLRGQHEHAGDPTEVLAELLTYAGVRGSAVPAGQEARATAFRAALSGRRVLLVLDDAESAAQVEPLLPGGAPCAVLVTSRTKPGRLVALHGGHAVNLDTLDEAAAASMLTAIFHTHAISVPQSLVDELARLCGNLPLALRIAGANVVTGPPEVAADYVRHLRDGDRLSRLAVDGDSEVAIRAAIEPSYGRLGDRARRALRLQASSPSDCFTIADIVTLLDTGVDEAVAVTSELTVAHLARPSHSGRFFVHDLIRLYAAERSQLEDSNAERAASVARLFRGYLATADATARRCYPRMTFLPLPEGRPVEPESKQWFRTEYRNVLSAIAHAARSGPATVAWQLADRLRGYLQEIGAHGEWRSSAEAGMNQARSEGDDHGIAAMHCSLALLSASRAEYADARERWEAALAIYARLADRSGMAAIYNNLGIVNREQGLLSEASDSYQHALRLYRELGQRHAELSTLSNLGVVELELDQLTNAIDCQRNALAGYTALSTSDLDNDVATALHNLAVAVRAVGQLGLAVSFLTRALVIHRRLDNAYGVANDLSNLATAYVDLGYYAKARHLVDECLAIARRTGRRRVEAEALNADGATWEALGDLPVAIAQHQAALRLSEAIGYRRAEIGAHIGLAICHQSLGRYAEATHQSTVANRLARSVQHHLLARQALEVVGSWADDSPFPRAVPQAG